MKTAILYARVARAINQDINQAQLQFDDMKAFCEKRGIIIVGRHYDIGSGATFERRGFQEMMEAIRSGKEQADIILVARWDRFSRNLRGALEMIKTLRTMGIKVKSLQDFESNDFEIILKHVLTNKK